MKKISVIMIFLLILIIVFTGCTQNPANESPSNDLIKEKDEKIADLEKRIKDLEENLSNSNTPNNIISTAADVMELIKNQDMNSLSQYVHPTLGVRFTPYFNVDTQTDQVFTSAEVVTLMQNSQVFNWGVYDGSGEAIDLDFSDYYDKFIYDQDFLNPELIGNNFSIGKGNMEDNVAVAYPNGQFVEFHFTQFDPQYEGIDWESLRLVFEQDNNTWYLVGIIHGQWTI